MVTYEWLWGKLGGSDCENKHKVKIYKFKSNDFTRKSAAKFVLNIENSTVQRLKVSGYVRKANMFKI